jgi:insertion element IS1 protein InsB
MVMGVCPQCQGERLVKHGSAAGKPQKRCKQCGDQFTRTTPRGKPLATKSNAVLWYLSGMSMHRMAILLRVSTQAVLTWSRDLATAYYEKPEPTGRTIVLQRDAMGHSLKHKRGKLWMWKALDRDTGQLLDWEWGRRDKKTLQKMVDRLAQWDVTMYCTDKWATYASVIPQDKLVQSKATTHDIERNHCRQRHWFGRFKRKSIIVSKSKEMVDLTMALFAKFWVNGNQDELLSLLD